MILTIRYTSDGDTAWTARYNGGFEGDDYAYALALHSSSRVFVTGKSIYPGTFNDIVTVRYNLSTGAET